MKTLVSSIPLLIFLHTIITREAKTSSSSAYVPVLDTDGDALGPVAGYHILPVFRPGGGIFDYPIPNTSCAYAVAQMGLSGRGIALHFFPNEPQPWREEIVPLSSDVLVIHSGRDSTGCENTWKVDESSEQRFIIVGGTDPDFEAVSSRLFKIEKAGSDDGVYKFVFCPSPNYYKADESVVACGDVGIYFQDGVRRLALGGSDLPFTFRFRKAWKPEGGLMGGRSMQTVI